MGTDPKRSPNAFKVASLSASNYLQDNSSDRLAITSYWQLGNATGEGITINANSVNGSVALSIT